MARRALLTLSASLVIFTSLLGGCDDVVTLDGAGVACISPTDSWPDEYPMFQENDDLYVIVRLDDCLSSSCNTGAHAICTVVRENDRLIIESEGGYTDESGPGDACTSDCYILETSCQLSETLDAGTYTVVYGDAEIQVEIPGVVGVYCVPTS